MPHKALLLYPRNLPAAGFGRSSGGAVTEFERSWSDHPSCYGLTSAASGLDGLLEPLSRCLDVESARRVIYLQIEAPVQERIDMLAGWANDGTLSDSERSEYEALVNAADFHPNPQAQGPAAPGIDRPIADGSGKTGVRASPG